MILITLLAPCAVLLFSAQDGRCLSAGFQVGPDDNSSDDDPSSILKRHFTPSNFDLGNTTSDFQQSLIPTGNFSHGERNALSRNLSTDNTTSNIVKRQIILSNLGPENSTEGFHNGIPPPGKGYLLGHGIFFVSGYTMRRKKHTDEANGRAQSSAQNVNMVKSPFEMGLPIVLQHSPGDQVTNIINIGKFGQPEEIDVEQLKRANVEKEDLSHSSYRVIHKPESGASKETSQENGGSAYDGEYYEDEDYDNTGYDYYEYYDRRSGSYSGLGKSSNPREFVRESEEQPTAFIEAAIKGNGNREAETAVVNIPGNQFDNSDHTEPDSYSIVEDVRELDMPNNYRERNSLPVPSRNQIFQQDISTSIESLSSPASFVSKEGSKQHGPLAPSENIQLPQTHTSNTAHSSEDHRLPEFSLKPPASSLSKNRNFQSEPVSNGGGRSLSNSHSDREFNPSRSSTKQISSNIGNGVHQILVFPESNNELDSYSTYEQQAETELPNSELIRSPDSSHSIKRNKLSSVIENSEATRPHVPNTISKGRKNVLSDTSNSDVLSPIAKYDNSQKENLNSFDRRREELSSLASSDGLKTPEPALKINSFPKPMSLVDNSNEEISSSYTSIEENVGGFLSSLREVNKDGYQTTVPNFSAKYRPQNTLPRYMYGTPKSFQSNGSFQKSRSHSFERNQELQISDSSLENDENHRSFAQSEKTVLSDSTMPIERNNNSGNILNSHRNSFPSDSITYSTYTTVPQFTEDDVLVSNDKNQAKRFPFQNGELDKSSFTSAPKAESIILSNNGLKVPGVTIGYSGDSNKSSYSSIENDEIENDISNESFKDYVEKDIQINDDHNGRKQRSKSTTDYDRNFGQSSYSSFERLDDGLYVNNVEGKQHNSPSSYGNADRSHSLEQSSDSRPLVQVRGTENDTTFNTNIEFLDTQHNSLSRHKNKSISNLPEVDLIREDSDTDSYVSYIRNKELKAFEGDDDSANLKPDLASEIVADCPSGKNRHLERENLSNERLGKPHSLAEKLRLQQMNPSITKTIQAPRSFMQRDHRNSFANDKMQAQSQLFDVGEKNNQPLLFDGKEGKMHISSLDMYGRVRHSDDSDRGYKKPNSFGNNEGYGDSGVVLPNGSQNYPNTFMIDEEIRPPKSLAVQAKPVQTESFTNDQKFEDQNSFVENESDIQVDSSIARGEFVHSDLVFNHRGYNVPLTFPIGERTRAPTELSIHEKPDQLNSFEKDLVGRHGEAFTGKEGSTTLSLFADRRELGQHGLFANNRDSTNPHSFVQKEIPESPRLDTEDKESDYVQTFAINENIRPPRMLYNNGRFELIGSLHDNHGVRQANSFDKSKGLGVTESNKEVSPSNLQIGNGKVDIVNPGRFAVSPESKPVFSFPTLEEFSPDKSNPITGEASQLKTFSENRITRFLSPTLNGGYGLRLITKRPAATVDKNHSTSELLSRDEVNKQTRNAETTTSQYTSSADIDKEKSIQTSILATNADLKPQEFLPINDVNVYKKLFEINRGFVLPSFVNEKEEKNRQNNETISLDDDRHSENIKHKRASEEDTTEFIAEHDKSIFDKEVISHYIVDTLSENGINSTYYVVRNDENSDNNNDHTSPLVQSVNFHELSDIFREKEEEFEDTIDHKLDDVYDLTVYKIDNGNITNLTQNLTDFIHNSSSFNNIESIGGILDALRIMEGHSETDNISADGTENKDSPIVVFHQSSGEQLFNINDDIKSFVPNSNDKVKLKTIISNGDNEHMPLYNGPIRNIDIKVNLDSSNSGQIEDIAFRPLHSQLFQRLIQGDSNEQQPSFNVNQEVAHSKIENKDQIKSFTSENTGFRQVDQGNSLVELGELAKRQNLENSQISLLKEGNEIRGNEIQGIIIENDISNIGLKQMAFPFLIPINTNIDHRGRSLSANTLNDNVHNFVTVDSRGKSQEGLVDTDVITQAENFVHKGDQTIPNVDKINVAGNRVELNKNFRSENELRIKDLDKSIDEVTSKKSIDGVVPISGQRLQEKNKQAIISEEFPVTNSMLINPEGMTANYQMMPQYADPQMLNQKFPEGNRHDKVTPFTVSHPRITENPENQYDDSMYSRGNQENAHEFREDQVSYPNTIQNSPDTTFQGIVEPSHEEQGTTDILGSNVKNVSEEEMEELLPESVAAFLNAFTRLTPGGRGRGRVKSDANFQENSGKSFLNENEEIGEKLNYERFNVDTVNEEKFDSITKIQNYDNFVNHPSLTDTFDKKISLHLNQGNEGQIMNGIEGRSLIDFFDNETSPGISVANESRHNLDTNFANIQSAFTDFAGNLRRPFNHEQQPIILQDDQAKFISNEKIQTFDDLVSLQPPINSYQEDFPVQFSQVSPQEVISNVKEIDLVNIPRPAGNIGMVHANGQIMDNPDLTGGKFVRAMQEQSKDDQFTQFQGNPRDFSTGSGFQISTNIIDHHPITLLRQFSQDHPGHITGNMEDSVLSKVQDTQKSFGTTTMDANEFGRESEFHDIEAAVTDFARNHGRQIYQEQQTSPLLKSSSNGINSDLISSVNWAQLQPPLIDFQEELPKQPFPENQTSDLLEYPGNNGSSENLIGLEDFGPHLSPINNFQVSKHLVHENSGNGINRENIQILNNLGLLIPPKNEYQEESPKLFFQEQQIRASVKSPENNIDSKNIKGLGDLSLIQPPIHEFKDGIPKRSFQGQETSALLQRPEDGKNIGIENLSLFHLPINDFQGESLKPPIHKQQAPNLLEESWNGINTENIENINNFDLHEPTAKGLLVELPNNFFQESQTPTLLKSDNINLPDLRLLQPPVNGFYDVLPKYLLHEQQTSVLPKSSENGINSESFINPEGFHTLDTPMNIFSKNINPVRDNPITTGSKNNTTLDFSGIQSTTNINPITSFRQHFINNNENSGQSPISIAVADGSEIQFTDNMRSNLLPVTSQIVKAELVDNSGFPSAFGHSDISGINFSQEEGASDSRVSTNAGPHGNINLQSSVINDFDIQRGREGNINLDMGEDFGKKISEITSKPFAIEGQQVNVKSFPNKAFLIGKTELSEMNDQISSYKPGTELHINGFIKENHARNGPSISFSDFTNGQIGNADKYQPLIDIRNEQGSSKDIVSRERQPIFSNENNLKSSFQVIPEQFSQSQGGITVPDISRNIHGGALTFTDGQHTINPEQHVQGQGITSVPDTFETVQNTNMFPNVQTAVTNFAGEFKGLLNQDQQNRRLKENQVKTTVNEKLHQSDNIVSIQPASNTFNWNFSGQFLQDSPNRLPAKLHDNSFNFPNVKTTIIAVPVESSEQALKDNKHTEITLNREHLVDTGSNILKIQPAVAIDLGHSDLSIQKNQGKFLDGVLSSSTIQPPSNTKVILVRYNEGQNPVNNQGRQEIFKSEENNIAGFNNPEHQSHINIEQLGQINHNSRTHTEDFGQFMKNDRPETTVTEQERENVRFQLGNLEQTSYNIITDNEDLGQTGQSIESLSNILENTGKNIQLNSFGETSENTRVQSGTSGQRKQNHEKQTNVLGHLLQNAGPQNGADNFGSSESQESSEYDENPKQFSEEDNCGGEWLPVLENEP